MTGRGWVLFLMMLAFSQFYLKARDKVPQDASSLAVGAKVPAYSFIHGPCTAIVAFDSSCPYCEAARDREKPDSKTVWLTWRDNPGNAAFPRVVVDSTAYRIAFQVSGVPVAFAVDSTYTVTYVGAYAGREEICRA